MSTEIAKEPAEDCPGSCPQEDSAPNEEATALDRDEILRKRRERRKQKREEIRKIKSLMKQQKSKMVPGKQLEKMKEMMKMYDQNTVLSVDLLLEIEKSASASAPAPAPARPGIVRKNKLKKLNFGYRRGNFTRKFKKGKTREVPKKHVTKLKRGLLQFRKERKTREIAKIFEGLKLETTKLRDAVKNPETIKEDAKSSSQNVPKVVDEIMLDAEEKSTEEVVEPRRPIVHSRKFRPYCDNTTSKKICELTEKLLKKIFTYQKRAYEKNVIKGSAHRRYVYGFNEVQRQVEINKAKLVIIAPDCEPAEFPGGLEDIIKTLKDKCKERDIPYLFSIKRRGLAYSLFKKVPVSCVAILNYDGAQDLFQELMDTLTVERENYTASLK